MKVFKWSNVLLLTSLITLGAPAFAKDPASGIDHEEAKLMAAELGYEKCAELGFDTWHSDVRSGVGDHWVGSFACGAINRRASVPLTNIFSVTIEMYTGTSYVSRMY